MGKNYKREEVLYILEDLDPSLVNILDILQCGKWKFHIFSEYPQYFEVWWDPGKFNWELGSEWLIENMKHKFDVWWDPEKFNWSLSACRLLAMYLSDRFLDWWNPNKFVWSATSYLIEYCGKYIDVWIKDCPKEILSDSEVEKCFIHSDIPPGKWICYLPKDSDLFRILSNLTVEDLKKFKVKNLLD